jgi:hypothetical protein
VLTEKTLDDTGATKEHLPRKSRVKLAQQADTFVSLVRTTTKLLKLCPYKITQVISQMFDTAFASLFSEYQV